MLDSAPSQSPRESWYAVQTRPKQETRAELNLVSLGVRTFLPMVRHAGRRSGTAQSSLPLFPRYLFVQCDIDRFAHGIRYTRGVAKVLGTGEAPTSIDQSIIHSIQERIGADGFVELVESLDNGDHVEVTSGPLKGFIGVFQSTASAARRVMLLLDAVGSHMRVMVDSHIVRRVTASPPRGDLGIAHPHRR